MKHVQERAGLEPPDHNFFGHFQEIQLVFADFKTTPF